MAMTFDPARPLSQACTIPNTWYTDAAQAATESQKVYGRTWQFVARRDQLIHSGAYVTAEIAGEPILLIRGDDGVLRGFYNVCRHRAAPLLNEPCGEVSKLRCRYHGWTYDLTGRLRGTPEFDGVECFRKKDNGLVPIAVTEWGPFVAVCLETPRLSLQDYLAPFPDWFARQPMDRLQFTRRVVYDLNCNWKVYIDNYLDGGYHVNTVHPNLAGVLDYSGYRTELHAHCSAQISPLVPGDPNNPATATRTGTEAHYWWIFPNFTINCYAGVMDTNLVLPLGPERCRVIFDYYFDRDTDPGFIDRSIEVADQVQQEDIEICEQVQHGLHSRSYTTGRFSVKRENGGYHFHQLLASYLQ